MQWTLAKQTKALTKEVFSGMDWSAFIGAAVGTILTIVIAISTLLIWDYYDRKKSSKDKSAKTASSKPRLDDLLESNLEEFIVQKFDALFPHWKIYDDFSSDITIISDSRPKGVRYRTDAGEIDILCTDEDGNFVVIELKRNKASDKVVSQVNRYIAWVEKNLANPNQTVRGIVIAKSFNKHLLYSLSKNDEIDLWIYNWELAFNREISLEAEFVTEMTE